MACTGFASIKGLGGLCVKPIPLKPQAFKTAVLLTFGLLTPHFGFAEKVESRKTVFFLY
jgi:hypothetical protein